MVVFQITIHGPEIGDAEFTAQKLLQEAAGHIGEYSTDHDRRFAAQCLLPAVSAMLKLTHKKGFVQVSCRRTDTKNGENELFLQYYPTIWIRKDGACWQEHRDGDPYLAWDNPESALISMLEGITQRLAERRRYAATVA